MRSRKWHFPGVIYLNRYALLQNRLGFYVVNLQYPLSFWTII